MNKWKNICAIAVVVVVGVTYEIIMLRGEHREFIRVASRSIGSDLTTTAFSSHLVGISPDLRASLSELRSSRTQVADVLFGDEKPPIGDGVAACRLVLTNDAGKGLLIRLRVADKSGRFQVLGFKALSE